MEHEVVHSDKFITNLLPQSSKKWTDMVSVALTTAMVEKDQLEPECPKTINPTLIPLRNHLSPFQRTEVVKLQAEFQMLGCTDFIKHHIETCLGNVVCIPPLAEDK